MPAGATMTRAATEDDDSEVGWSINYIVATAETSVRAVRDAIDAGILEVWSRRPTRISRTSAERFIAVARDAKLDQVRLAAPDLLEMGYVRPYQLADRLGLDERIILSAIQRCRLPAVARGLWLFVSRNDAEDFAAAHQTRRAAA